MALFDVFGIAGSAMSAQSIRLNVTASNLANVDTVGLSKEQTFRARQPVFQTMLNTGFDGSESFGVRVTDIIESGRQPRQQYQPEHPYADENGYVFLPDVDAIEEMANMISASRAYQNNVEIINTSKEMLLLTLSLGQ